MKTSLFYLVITGCVVGVSIWATDLYDASLRNPRFFDGWVLAAAMSIQLLLHACRKRWIVLPLKEEGPIKERLDMVEMFIRDEELAAELKSRGIKEDELNHYVAYNLIYSRRYREAAVLSRLLLTIFPEAGHLHLTLARVYEALGDEKLALQSYSKAFLYVSEKGKLEIIRDAISRSQGFE